ncbi:AlwI family type II restriction endonuclease, partial [Clostridium botulinum]|nr:AlwI family type II restriction endonuclease [Clostridium botulinum]
LTKYIYIRGKYAYTYIGLEPRRMTEINSILENDSGSSKKYTPEEWRKYMGTYNTYVLPFETEEKLTEILDSIIIEINKLENKLSLKKTIVGNKLDNKYLKATIEKYRQYRTRLQNLEIKMDYNKNLCKIDETIEALKNIRDRKKSKLDKKYSIELEKWTNVALNIINDSRLIKPNAPVGDDNEPTYTAPNGVPDIECYYESFGAICEVTMLTSRDQWYNEGQPVMRHLRAFENSNSCVQNYCLFIAPSLHQDTINTFYTSVKYEYEGKKQKIIPITITQLICILETVKLLKLNGKELKHTDVMDFYNLCITLNDVANSTVWCEHISNILSEWTAKIIS